MAIFDFDSGQRAAPELGPQVADALAAELKNAGYTITTRQQIEQATANQTTANDSNARQPYTTDLQRRRAAQAAGAKSLFAGKLLRVAQDRRNRQSFRAEIEVRQLNAATGALQNTITVSEAGANPGEAINRAVATAVRFLRRTR